MGWEVEKDKYLLSVIFSGVFTVSDCLNLKNGLKLEKFVLNLKL